jgi:hypothetical protein
MRIFLHMALPHRSAESKPQLGTNLAKVQFRSAFFSHHGNIGVFGQDIQITTKKFPDLAFYPVSLHRPANLPTHCQPEPGRTFPGLEQHNHEVGAVSPTSLTGGEKKIFPPAHSPFFGKLLPH